MKVVAVIPARADSKRLPRKNILKLGGITLIDRSINFARKLKFIDDIVISTDDSYIIKKNRKKKFLKVFNRSKNLSGKNVKTIDVLIDVIKEYEKNFDRIETILLLQATSPFRSKKKIYYAYKKYKEFKKIKSIISVSENNSTEGRKFDIKNSNLYHSRNADIYKKKIYKVNGNYYIASSDFLKKNKSFYFKKKTFPVILKSPCLSVDIDTRKDLLMAKSFLGKTLEDLNE